MAVHFVDTNQTTTQFVNNDDFFILASDTYIALNGIGITFTTPDGAGRTEFQIDGSVIGAPVGIDLAGHDRNTIAVGLNGSIFGNGGAIRDGGGTILNRGLIYGGDNVTTAMIDAAGPTSDPGDGFDLDILNTGVIGYGPGTNSPVAIWGEQVVLRNTGDIFGSVKADQGLILTNTGLIDGSISAAGTYSFSGNHVENSGVIAASIGIAAGRVENDGTVYGDIVITDDVAVPFNGNVIQNDGSAGFLVIRDGAGWIFNTGVAKGFSIDAGASLGKISNTGTVLSEAPQFVRLLAETSTLYNSGVLETSWSEGILAWGTESTVISNSGRIAAGLEAISFGRGAARLDNSGVIEVRSDNGRAVDHDRGSETLTLRNSGTIIGDIRMGDVGDLLDTSGTIHGDVMMGTGTDTFVYRGGTISGIVAGQGGGDTYQLRAWGEVQIVELAGDSGFDRMEVWHTAALADNVEVLALMGVDDIKGFGTAGHDSLQGNIGNNVLSGRGGNDTLTGGAGDDTLYGGTGDDTLVLGAGPGDDMAYGGLGRDGAIVSLGATGDVDLNAGKASLFTSDGLIGTARIWSVEDATGGLGNDTLSGNAGDNRLSGNLGNDTILGRLGNDLLDGGGGNDTLKAGEGDDTVLGGFGADDIQGGSGDDSLSGGAQNDTLTGGAGRDTLEGGDGDDVLDGGTWVDTLSGGAGNDTLTGGTGADLFVFEAGAQVDSILDFEDGVDLIDVSDFHLPFGWANVNVVLTFGGYTRVTFDTVDNEIRLFGIAPASVDASDFVFA